MAFLRRQLSFRQPYEKVQAEADIKRLKREVKEANQSLRENVAVIKETQEGPLSGLVLVDQTVRYTNQIQQERRALQEEVERLKLRIEQLETLQGNEQALREKFYEGAAWLGKEAVEDANTGLSYVKEQLQREYERKLEEAGRDDMLRQRVSHWVMD